MKEECFFLKTITLCSATQMVLHSNGSINQNTRLYDNDSNKREQMKEEKENEELVSRNRSETHCRPINIRRLITSSIKRLRLHKFFRFFVVKVNEEKKY